jgi:hypothetical protein
MAKDLELKAALELVYDGNGRRIKVIGETLSILEVCLHSEEGDPHSVLRKIRRIEKKVAPIRDELDDLLKPLEKENMKDRRAYADKQEPYPDEDHEEYLNARLKVFKEVFAKYDNKLSFEDDDINFMKERMKKKKWVIASDTIINFISKINAVVEDEEAVTES